MRREINEILTEEQILGQLMEECAELIQALNRLTAALADFMNREDANTLGDELTYWAEKRGIKF